jgi:D-glycero-D-manno-heptose 1,7-bisphosphate phosphatase
MTFEDKGRPVVFLDRDGTLNIESGYIRDVNNLVLIDGAAQAVSKLNKAGVFTALVTNQSGAARNYYPESHIVALHERLTKLLGDTGAFLDAIYYCPHLPEATNSDYRQKCNCRKPATGMIDRAFREHPELSRQNSFMVGDKICDVELAHNSKIKGVLVKTGYGEETAETIEASTSINPDLMAESIIEAVDWILENLSQRSVPARHD